MLRTISLLSHKETKSSLMNGVKPLMMNEAFPPCTRAQSNLICVPSTLFWGIVFLKICLNGGRRDTYRDVTQNHYKSLNASVYGASSYI